LERTDYAFPPFRQFNLPTAILWIYFVTIIASLFEYAPDGSLYIILYNTLALTTVLLLLQGFSFIFFYADVKGWHLSIPIIVLVLTFILPFLFMFLIRIIGIIDLGFSLKKRLQKKET